MNRLLFPGPSKDFANSRESYSDLSVVSTGDFLHGLEVGTEYEVVLEPGNVFSWACSPSVTLTSGTCARSCVPSTASCARCRSATSRLRSTFGRPREPTPHSRVRLPQRSPVSSRSRLRSVNRSTPGAAITTIEAMKMDASITSPVGGTLQRLVIGAQQQVEGGDLLIVVA